MRIAWLGLVLLGLSLKSQAVGNLADVQIVDRKTGQTLPIYHSRGEFWVAGAPGARYAVMIRNQRGERVMAVTSVDGVNVISGETAAWDQSGYVFTAWQQYAVDGWRKNNQEVAAFNFTSLPDSYAARTGRPANVGVIGVALFLEKPAPQVPPAPASPLAGREEKPSLDSLNLSDSAAEAGAAQRGSALPADRQRPRLGTGHGEREWSYVSDTRFDRLSSAPNEIIRIRYDRLESLVAMGVVKPRPVPSVPNAFPDSAVGRFVPDPPGF